jgi:glycosyltransferase involved in cell wall biosynthesis
MFSAEAQYENPTGAPDRPRASPDERPAVARVLMLSYEYPPLGGGGGGVVKGLTQSLGQLEQPIDLVTMRAAGHPRQSGDNGLSITNVPCIRTNQSVCYFPEMIPYVLFGLPVLLKKVRKERYLINHTHFIFPDGILAWLLFKFTGLPYVLTAHGSDVPGYNPDRFSVLHKLLRPLWLAITNNAASIICPSHHLESLLLRANPNAKTEVLPNGIDVDRFHPASKREDSILVVTRMVRRKGVQYLIEALEGWDNHPVVNIVGDGPYLDTLKALARKKNVSVNFVGFLDNKSERFKTLLETSRYFIFTSSAENFPVVLLEAMSAGLAIITTNDTGCAEAVGDAALLVPPKDAGAIQKALKKLIDDRDMANSLMQKARNRVTEQFDQASLTARHIEIYRQHGRKQP